MLFPNVILAMSFEYIGDLNAWVEKKGRTAESKVLEEGTYSKCRGYKMPR